MKTMHKEEILDPGKTREETSLAMQETRWMTTKTKSKLEGRLIGTGYDPLGDGYNVQRPGIQKDEDCSKG